MTVFYYQFNTTDDDYYSPITTFYVDPNQQLDAESVEDLVDDILAVEEKNIHERFPPNSEFIMTVYQYEHVNQFPLNGVILVRKTLQYQVKTNWESSHVEGLYKTVISHD